MAAAITTGHPTSNWRDETQGWYEAVIQARGGYTRYWTFNNRCRQVIHKWRFEMKWHSYRAFWNVKVNA
jgi:hypothetical protein